MQKIYVMNHFEYRENERADENMSESPTSSTRIFAEQLIDYIRLSDMDNMLCTMIRCILFFIRCSLISSGVHDYNPEFKLLIPTFFVEAFMPYSSQQMLDKKRTFKATEMTTLLFLKNVSID